MTREDLILEIRGLKTYMFTDRGVVQAVDGVDLDVNRNETVGVVGESGCGKSLTALSIMHLIPSPPGRIVAGEILYHGTNLLSLSERDMQRIRGREIAMVFQDPSTFLNPVLKVGQQLAEVIRMEGQTSVQKRVEEVLDLVQLPRASRIWERYPHELSGGMRQRVLIAMALIGRPKLLIADEPTTALDVTLQAQILDLLRELQEELGMALILITHDLGVVAELCQRVFVMYAGEVIESGDVFELFDSPRHPYTNGLLNSVLGIDSVREKMPTIEGAVPDMIAPPTGCRFHPRCSLAMPNCSLMRPPCIRLNDKQSIRCWLFTDQATGGGSSGHVV